MTDEPERLPSAISFGRQIGGDLAAAEQREWLVTHGLGGYASGTVFSDKALVACVTRLAEEGRLAQIARLVE